MNKQKQLWDKLAEENSRYYINSDYGHGITEDKFRESGESDYKKYILEDTLITKRFNLKECTLLEIGCGTGRMTEFMANDFMLVVGTDVSGKMITEAAGRLEGLFNVELMETDGQSIPLPDDFVDIVFSYLVFQHIKDRDVVEDNFKEIYRVLRKGGVFKVLIRSDKVDLNKWWGGVEYTEQSIGFLIKKIGFDLLKTEPRDEFGFWLWLKK
jgi:ubiquinone/menaquinone biosynthesis C-methylase UbiE